MKAINIKYDTDDEIIDLPSEMEIPIGIDEDEVADYISDETGWLVEGFDLIQ